MQRISSHPAVYAGLMGNASWGVPKLTLATPFEHALGSLSDSLLLQFVAGCAIGAVVAGVVSLVIERIPADEDEGEIGGSELVATKQESSRKWETSSLGLTQQDEKDDPTGDLGRFRTGQIVIELSTVEPPAHAAAGETPSLARAAAGRHFATGTDQKKRVSTARNGRHFAVDRKAALATGLREAVETKSTASTPQAARGRHFATATQTREARPASVAATREEAATHAQAEAGAVATRAARLKPKGRHARPATIQHTQAAPAQAVAEAVQTTHEVRSAHPASVMAAVSPVSPDKVAAASKPTQLGAPTRTAPVLTASASGVLPVPHARAARLSGQRQTGAATGGAEPQRKRSVREVLAERLGGSGRNGIPVIPRADGSSVEMNASWFDRTLAPAIDGITGSFEKLGSTAPNARTMDTLDNMMAVAEQVPSSTAAAVAPTSHVPAPPMQTSRAAYISQRVAEVNVGMFPERRSADELEHEDFWDEAIAAMGETIEQDNPSRVLPVTPSAPAPVFHDAVGGPATIDDPDGLEDPTGILPFRPAAMRQQAIGDAPVSSSGSLSPRSTGSLRVIEGGVSAQRSRRRASETGPLTRGRHFASERIAQEA